MRQHNVPAAIWFWKARLGISGLDTRVWKARQLSIGRRVMMVVVVLESSNPPRYRLNIFSFNCCCDRELQSFWTSCQNQHSSYNKTWSPIHSLEVGGLREIHDRHGDKNPRSRSLQFHESNKAFRSFLRLILFNCFCPSMLVRSNQPFPYPANGWPVDRALRPSPREGV